MRKQKLPTFEELIERLYQSILLRHPGEPAGELLMKKLESAWSGKDKQLYEMVKQLEINEHKVNVINRKVDVRDATYQCGVDFLGFPIYVQHIVKFENVTRDPKRYRKKGSDFNQELKSATQVEFKEGNRLKQVLIFK
jgi:hypothetical protein